MTSLYAARGNPLNICIHKPMYIEDVQQTKLTEVSREKVVHGNGFYLGIEHGLAREKRSGMMLSYDTCTP